MAPFPSRGGGLFDADQAGVVMPIGLAGAQHDVHIQKGQRAAGSRQRAD